LLTPLSGWNRICELKGPPLVVDTATHTPAQINGVVFTSYSFFMKLQVHSHASTEPTLAQITLAGAGSGVLGS
jgi:hypothetical protein